MRGGEAAVPPPVASRPQPIRTAVAPPVESDATVHLQLAAADVAAAARRSGQGGDVGDGAAARKNSTKEEDTFPDHFSETRQHRQESIQTTPFLAMFL